MSKKKPHRSVNVSGNKKSSSKEDPNNWLRKNPVWVFSRHDNQHDKWSLTCCRDIYDDVISKLASFEGMTWGCINQQTHDKGKSSNHFIEISKLTKDAQNRIESLHIYEDEIYSLRLSNKERLFGVIEDNKFCIIWYDKNHEVYPYKKKHT